MPLASSFYSITSVRAPGCKNFVIVRMHLVKAMLTKFFI